MTQQELQWPILVVDDQIGSPGAHQLDFLDEVGGLGAEFVFVTGQTAGRRNDMEGLLRQVRAGWPMLDGRRWSLVLLDVRFDQKPLGRDDDKFGFRILEELRREFGPALPIAMLTSEDDAKRREANSKQADAFLPKERLKVGTLQAVRETRGLMPDASGKIVGSSLPLLMVLRDLRQFAHGTDKEILLLGETGAGKERFSHFVHETSPRRNGRFELWTAKPTNAELQYGELFGHWKGAHDGAKSNAAGAAETAHKGTLFLDEVANLAPETQAQLLEYREWDKRTGFRRVKRLGLYREATGGVSGNPSRTVLDLHGDHYDPSQDRVLVDTLIVSATNADLANESYRERIGFRDDLFYALGRCILVPQLRELGEDVVRLFETMLNASREKSGWRPATLAEAVKQRVRECSWAGNVRTLEDVAVQVSERLGADFDEILEHHVRGTVLDEASPGLRKAAGRDMSPPSEPEVRTATSSAPLAIAQVDGIRAEAEALRRSVLETYRAWNADPRAALSVKHIVKYATGVEMKTTEAKRTMLMSLKPLFNPASVERTRWEPIAAYQDAVEQADRDDILRSLYDYANNDIDWDAAADRIAKAMRSAES